MPPTVRTALTGASFALAGALCFGTAAQAQRSTCRAHEVQLAPSEGEVVVNGTAVILATTYDAAGNPCDNVSYTWTSSNTRIATVDNGGVVHGIAVGSVSITARTGSGSRARTGRATFTVVAAPIAPQVTPENMPGQPASAPRPPGQGGAAVLRQPPGDGPADIVNVEPLQVVLIKGESRQLSYRALKADGSPAAPVPIVFQVTPGGPPVVTVDTFGVVTALADTGTATVSLTVPNQSHVQQRIVRVEVRNDSVVFNRRELTLAPGMTDTLTPFVPAQNRTLNARLFQFSSSDPTKVQVTPTGVVTAVAPGTVTITGQYAYVPDIHAIVHVHRPVRTVTLRPEGRPAPADSTVVIPIGGSVTLRARALAEDGSDVAEAGVRWRVQDAGGAAQVDTARGTVRGLRSGTLTIYVSALVSRDSSAQASLRVRVVAGGLLASASRVGLGVGERVPIAVTLLDDQRRPAGSAIPYLTWTSDSTARIENGDQVVGVRAGHTRLVGRTSWDSSVTVDVYVVGDLLVVGRVHGRSGLLMLNRAGDVLGSAADSLVEFAAWEPGLTRAAYTRVAGAAGKSLWIANLDEANPAPVRLTDDSTTAKYPVFVPGLARGAQIVFEWNKGGRAQIWRINLPPDSAPGAPEPITNSPAQANMAPAVSPDGRRIAYVSVRETSPGRPSYGVYTANLDGSEEHQVMVVPQGHRILGSPAFAPDGRSLLFVRAEPPRDGLPTNRVLRVPLTAQPGDTAVALTPAQIVVQSFSLSPDGATMALNTLEPLQGGRYNTHLLLYTVASGATQRLDPPDMQPSNPAFRPATPGLAAVPSH